MKIAELIMTMNFSSYFYLSDSLVTALEEAISKGNVDQARDMAEVLARKKAKLCINLISVGDDGSSNTFKLVTKWHKYRQVFPQCSHSNI